MNLRARWWRCPRCDAGITEMPDQPFKLPPICKCQPLQWMVRRESEYLRLGKLIFTVNKMKLPQILDLACRVLPKNWELHLVVDDGCSVMLLDQEGREVQPRHGRDNLLTELEDALEFALEQKDKNADH